MSVPAMTADWDGDTSTDWDDVNNWTGGTTPTNGADIVINIDEADPPFSPAITSVTANTNLPNSAIVIGNGSGSDAGLTISNGGILQTRSGSIGTGVGATGRVTVTGTNSAWTNSSNLYVGSGGTGTLTVSDGASVSGDDGFLGYSGSEAGSAVVTGIDSSGNRSTLTINGSFFDIGLNGHGALTIEDGGLVESITTDLGEVAGSSGTATVSGVHSSGVRSTWNNTSFLNVGRSGTGALTISDGGLVDVDSNFSIAVSAGSTGTLNIGAASGDAAVAPGILDTNGVQFGAGTGTLVFNHTDETGTYAFTPAMATGNGVSVINHYAGFTRLTGNAGGFTQTTNIHGGTLAVENMLGGLVNVMNGGTLGGSGQITGTVTIGNGGILAPGSSIGTLNVTGDVTQETGSAFVAEVDDLGNGDLLAVTGNYIIQSGVTLDVQPENGTDDGSSYPPLTQYTIITASDGVSGMFDTVTEDFLFLVAIASYDANNVYLTLEQVYDFVEAAVTPNQMQVAGALDGLPSGNPIKDAMLYILDDAEAQDAFNQLSGEAHASLKGALVENGQQAVKAVNDRIHSAFEAENANTSVSAYGKTADPENGFWLNGYGNWMTTDATGNTAEMSNDLYGVIAGIDRRFGDYGRLGILGGYSRTNTSVDALASQADADSYTVGVYGGADNGKAALSLGALYTWHSIESSRYVTNPVTEMLNADYDARSFQLFAEAGYKATMDRVTLEPFAGVSYINLNTDSFSETGGSAALSSSSETTSTTFTTLGLRSSIELASNVSTRGMVGWRHAFGDVDPSSTFTIGGSGPFSILGAPIAQDAAVVEAGIDIKAGENVTIGASYEGQYGDGAIANGFNARLLAAF